MIIHQVLHGYRNGHNMLASSIHLLPKDDDLLKVMSDWSEYAGGVDGDSSYITAYPLKESGLYVVAKTWYAEEKERPGCVWTHSLVLDFSQIDASFDFRSLLSLFRRPVDGKYDSYSEPIDFSVSDVDRVSSTGGMPDLIKWMYLYVHVLQPTPETFIVESASEDYQNLCLSFMQQLPLSILKKRSFSSGSGAGRSIYDSPFSLQFTSRAGIRLSNLKEVNSLTISNFDSGIASICSANAKGKQDISEFIRLFDSDINGDVAKLSAIGKLYACMDGSQENKLPHCSINDVIYIIVDAFPSVYEGQKVKAAFLGKNVSNLFAKEEEVLFTLGVTTFSESFDYNVINYFQRTDEIAAAHSRDSYYNLLDQLVGSESLNNYGQSIIKNAVNKLSNQDLMVLLTGHWNTYLSLVSLFPQALANGLWVDLEEERFSAIYELFSKSAISSFAAWDKLFLRVLYQHYPITEFVWKGFLSREKQIVEDVMEYLNNSVQYDLDVRLRDYVAGNIIQLSNYLANQSSLNRVAKQFVMANVNPKNPEIANTDSRSWKIICDLIDCSSHSECAFLFLLSYNWKDNRSLQYLKKAYYPIYKSLLQSNLEYHLWSKIADYTAILFPWQEWDKCKKLRKGVVKYLQETGYSKDVLKSFTPEADLNDELMRIWK